MSILIMTRIGAYTNLSLPRYSFGRSVVTFPSPNLRPFNNINTGNCKSVYPRTSHPFSQSRPFSIIAASGTNYRRANALYAANSALSTFTITSLPSLFSIIFPFFIMTNLIHDIRKGDIFSSNNVKDKELISITHAEATQHRIEKFKNMVNVATPLTFITAAAATLNGLSGDKPSFVQLGLYFNFLMAYSTLDLCLDELKEFNTKRTATFCFIAVIGIIPLLTLKKSMFGFVGHPIFWLKALDILIGTAIAKTIDNLTWLLVASFSLVFFTTIWKLKLIAPIPYNVPMSGYLAYGLIGTSMSILYQVHQSSAKLNFTGGESYILRAVLNIFAMYTFNTPSSWILFSAVSHVLCSASKVISDTVALKALSSKG